MARLQLSSLQDRYFFCDPASGKKTEAVKRVRARSAIVGLAPDELNRLFVIFAWAERCSTNRLMDRILEVNEEFHPRVFGIEANAMQSLFADAVVREAMHKGVKLPLVSVEQPTKIDKDFRVRGALQPVVAFGRLFLQPHQHDLRHEVTSFPMSATKDLIDALASAVALVPVRATRRDRDRGAEDHLRYLRESGAPSEYIIQVAQSYGYSPQL